MKRIEHLIPIAIRAIEKNNIPVGEKKEVPNEYKGYIDTFGAVIVQNGLLPAVVFYENSGSDDIKEKRRKLLRAILEVIKPGNTLAAPVPDGMTTLYQYIIQGMQHKELKTLRREVVEAAIAVKLALRTFPFSKSE